MIINIQTESSGSHGANAYGELTVADQRHGQTSSFEALDHGFHGLLCERQEGCRSPVICRPTSLHQFLRIHLCIILDTTDPSKSFLRTTAERSCPSRRTSSFAMKTLFLRWSPEQSEGMSHSGLLQCDACGALFVPMIRWWNSCHRGSMSAKAATA